MRRAAARALAAALAPAAALGIAAAPAAAEVVRTARGAVLRALDKVSGETRDLELFPGAPQTLWRLTILLDECRYPVADPASNAYAHVTVRDSLMAAPAFRGWLIADSPALSAMDHARYDVWLIRCIID